MIKNAKFLQDFEDEYNRKNKMTVQEKFDMSDDLYKFAFSIGKLTIDDAQQNLETLAKTLKIFRNASKPIN